MIVQGRLLANPMRPPQPGWIRVADDRIAQMGDGRPPAPPDLGNDASLICPGFIDAHLHLPQIDSIGCDGMDLLEWLHRVIYPAEARWNAIEVARAQIQTAYLRMLRCGTLGYAGYLTSHFEGVVAVMRQAQRLPLRALVGQVLMDRRAPADMLGQRQARLARSQRGRLTLTLNPRFAISCSTELLQHTARRARPATVIQTHLAESERECHDVAQLFPDAPHYTAVYDRAGLLTPRTLLAHGVHLDEAQWTLIAARRSVIVHCPTANTFLGSGLFDLDAARRHGVRLAVGSDVAAGPDLAMPRVARAVIEIAKIRRHLGRPETHVPTPAEAWHMITTGNAKALGWEDGGRLQVGAVADLLVIEPPFALDDEHLMGRLLYQWDDAYITHRVLAGQLIANDATRFL